MLDTRGVEVIGEQLFISDGYDYRSASDPMNHAVFVYDVTGPGGGGSADRRRLHHVDDLRHRAAGE